MALAKRSLYNVLKAYSVYDRDVGYVQVCSLFCPISCLLSLTQILNEIEFVENAGNGFSGWVVCFFI